MQTKQYLFPIQPYLKLVGYFLSEGFLRNNKKAGSGIALVQSKGDVLDRMKAVLDELGLPYSEKEDPRKPSVVCLAVGGGKSLTAHFSRFGVGAANKHISKRLDAARLPIPSSFV